MKRISILLLILFTFLVSTAWPQAQAQWRHHKIITYDAPGAGTGAGQGTQAPGINPAGAITGFYWDDLSVAHGFVRDPWGNIITFDAPGAGAGPFQGTIPRCNNALDAITGYYVDAGGVNHGFLRS